MTPQSGAHRATADSTSPVVLRLLSRVQHPPAAVLVVASPGDARALDARGYRVTEVPSLEGAVGPYDLVCEAGLYSQLGPEARDRYVAAAAGVLRPGGRLFGEFQEGESSSASDLIHRFSPWFEVQRLEPSGFAGSGRATLEVVLTRR